MSDGGASGKGGLPAGWVETTLGEVAGFVMGQAPPGSASNFEGIGTIFVKAGEFGELRPVVREWTTQPLRFASDRDVLICVVGATAGKINLGLDCAIGRSVAAIRTIHPLMRDFVYRRLLLEVDSLRQSSSGSAQGVLSQSQLSNISLRLPPLSEQRRIAAKLDDLLGRSRRAKEALAEIPALLERYRQSVLAAAFRGDLTTDWRAKHPEVEPASELLKRIRVERRRRWEEAELARLTAKGKTPTDEKWKGKYEEPSQPDIIDGTFLPAGWLWTSMETVGDVHLGRQRAPQYQTGEHTHPYLRVANIKDDRIDSSDVNSMDFDPEDFEHYRLLPGDILLSEGQSPELVGQSAIYEGGIEGLCFQKTLHRFRRYGSAPSARFAQLVFRHYVRSGFFRSVASLTVNIAHLTLVRLKPLAFPLPPVEEQKVIEHRLTQAMRQIDALEATADQELERIHGVERSILTRAFRGELVPQDPADEPASVLLDRIRAERAAAPSPRTRGRKTTGED